MLWLGRRIRTRGFELGTHVITVAAPATALMAMLRGLQARATVSRDALLADLMQEHLTNGGAVTMATCVAAVVAMMEWRGWISRRIFWLRAALITWAAIGTVFSAHVGAQMVFFMEPESRNLVLPQPVGFSAADRR